MTSPLPALPDQIALLAARTGATDRKYGFLVDARRIEGELAADRLREVVTGSTTRHEALHARFARDRFGGWTQVLDATPRQVTFTSRRFSPADFANRTNILHWARQEIASRFDPFGWGAHGLLASSTDGSNHYFILAVDRLVCDAWSVDLLFDEIFAVYTTNRYLPRDTRYRSYVEHAVDWCASRSGRRMISTRRAHLATLLRTHRYLFSPTPSSIASASYNEEWLAEDLPVCLADLTRKDRISQQMVFLAAFAVMLLLRFGAAIFTTTVADRSQWPDVVGPLSHRSVVSLAIAPHEPFRDVCSSARLAVGETIEYRRVPLGALLPHLSHHARWPLAHFTGCRQAVATSQFVGFTPVVQTQLGAVLDEPTARLEATVFDSIWGSGVGVRSLAPYDSGEHAASLSTIIAGALRRPSDPIQALVKELRLARLAR